ncbi:hypothetical protein [Pelagovum pacificum]|uniref:hypothetical protein n=1 Tax=Pelagovum pacificum TaxID=2588711 RepID=UPI0018CF7349|nr:hypothetical protein [Pelagovum pacificum]QQA41349.1 hypothetical protein I8N54_10955 [Pelagovum pacificum]
MAFTIAVIVNAGVIFAGITEPPVGVYLLALVPLFALSASGICLFVLPYFGRRTVAW